MITDLLIPRFEIIADYPNNEFGEIGTILDRDWGKYPNDNKTLNPVWQISDFPYLFKKLEWWEKRTEKEMPKYLYCPNTKEYYEIFKWDMNNCVGFLDEKLLSCCDLIIWSNHKNQYLPATEREYNDYINSL